LKKFFVSEKIIVDLNSVRQVLRYQCGLEGSNEFEENEECVVEFELFLVKLSAGRCEGLSLRNFLFFSMAIDRIPVFGLPKKFEVYFVEGNKLPYNLEYALRNCVGYGLPRFLQIVIENL